MKDKKVLHKWWWVWDYEKEEEWLNQMAREGWLLYKVGFCKYSFEKCEPGEYNVCLVMHDKDQEYMDFMEQMGAEYAGRFFKWIYFKRKSNLGEFKIFSNIDSKIEHLSTISKMLLVFGILNVVVGIINSINGLHIGFINLLCACLLAYALGRMHGKAEELKKQRVLHE